MVHPCLKRAPKPCTMASVPGALQSSSPSTFSRSFPALESPGLQLKGSNLEGGGPAEVMNEELDMSFLSVLGQEGFLDRWVASFNFYDGYFVIEARVSFEQRHGVIRSSS
jgi:hypothetical protein